MSLTLTSAQVSRLERLTEAFVSPLRHPDTRAWTRELGRQAASLFEADGAIVVLPEEDGEVELHHVGGDPESEELLASCLAGTAPGVLRFEDPELDRMLGRVAAAGIRVWTTELAERVSRVPREETRFYHEVALPLGIAYQVNGAIALPEGQALLAVYHARPEDDALGERRIPLMELLRPAFRAGLTALSAYRERRRSFRTLLSRSTRTGVAVLDLEGDTVYRNPALGQMLERDPERERLLRAIDAFARSVRRVRLPDRQSTSDPPHPVPDDRELRTRQGTYRLGASLLPGGLFGRRENIMITVRCDACLLPSQDRLRERYEMTSRQAEVALLVARGIGTRAVADRLEISPHTVRRHVEAVHRKLGVHARGRVLPKLLADAGLG